MNKRGEEGGNYTGIIITIIIFALLLVILLVSFSGKSGGIFDSIKSLIPSSWGGVKPGLVEDGAFRYQIMEDKVQYYDGASWREFPVVDINGNKQPGVQIGDKVYVKEDVYNAYRNEYYGDVAPKITVGSLNPVLDYFKMRSAPTKAESTVTVSDIPTDNKVIFSIESMYSYPVDLKPGQGNGYLEIKGGDIIVRKYSKLDTIKDVQLFVFRYNGEVYELTGIPKDWIGRIREYTPWPAAKYDLVNNNVVAKVIPFVNTWRDSALKQPVEIAYYTYVKDDNGKEVLKEFKTKDKYCLEKMDYDLTIKLWSTTSGDTCKV